MCNLAACQFRYHTLKGFGEDVSYGNMVAWKVKSL